MSTPPSSSSPTVVDRTVYAATRCGSVHALTTEDGREQWRFDGGTDVCASLAVTADAVVYLAAHGGDLYALHDATEQTGWPQVVRVATTQTSGQNARQPCDPALRQRCSGRRWRWTHERRGSTGKEPVGG